MRVGVLWSGDLLLSLVRMTRHGWLRFVAIDGGRSVGLFVPQKGLFLNVNILCISRRNKRVSLNRTGLDLNLDRWYKGIIVWG
jgi:hypothetical protein